MYVLIKPITETAFYIPDSIMKNMKDGLKDKDTIAYLNKNKVAGIEELPYIPTYKPQTYQVILV